MIELTKNELIKNIFSIKNLEEIYGIKNIQIFKNLCIYEDYILNNESIKDLSLKYNVSEQTVYKSINKYKNKDLSLKINNSNKKRKSLLLELNNKDYKYSVDNDNITILFLKDNTKKIFKWNSLKTENYKIKIKNGEL